MLFLQFPDLFHELNNLCSLVVSGDLQIFNFVIGLVQHGKYLCVLFLEIIQICYDFTRQGRALSLLNGGKGCVNLLNFGNVVTDQLTPRCIFLAKN